MLGPYCKICERNHFGIVHIWTGPLGSKSRAPARLTKGDEVPVATGPAKKATKPASGARKGRKA